ALDLEATASGKRMRGGKERFGFENDFQLEQVRRVLNENWRRLPEGLDSAPKIEIEVRWAEKAGAKRVVTDQDAELTVGSESVSLPYRVCLPELLCGEPLYRQRRAMWGLPLPAVPAAKTPVPDGGAAARDGGSTADGAPTPGAPDAARTDR